MKNIIKMIFLLIPMTLMASVPTEEGLLKNLNNADIPGNLITIKSMVQSTAIVGNVNNSEVSKADFYKFILSTENGQSVSLLQINYSNGQMLNSQIKDVKYVPDLLAAIKKEKTAEKGMFYSVLMMLATNRSAGVEAFLEKSGVQIVHNKNILNENKMKLLRSYRTYLANNKGKGDANSPLNPADPQNKAKVVELFKSNTFQRSKNIELTKMDNEFLWAVDWKSTKAYFTNEERRLHSIDFTAAESNVKLEAREYILFNGTNELPKFISFKDAKGQTSKMQILGLDTKTNREKKISERYDEAKKSMTSTASAEANFSFLF